MNTDFVQYCATVKNQVEMSYVLGISCIVVTVLMIFVEWLRTPAFIILDLLFGIPFLLLLSSIRGRFKSINPDRLDVRYTALFKSFRRLVYSLNRAIVIVAIISAICTAFYLFHRSQDNAHFQELLTEAAEMRHEYSELLPPVIAERMKDMDYVEDVKVTASMLLTHNSLGDYTWNEKVRITLYVDDAFDKLSDNKQYAYLCEEESKGHDVIRETIRTCLPRYVDLRGELFHIIEHDRRGFVRSDMDYDYEVQTSENHYQYAHYVDDYFLLNGEDHFTSKHRAEIRAKYATPTPTPKQKRSTNRGKGTIIYDPDDIHNYDDPEDYWYDHEDEFDDFEDAWDYWEENY